MEVRGHLFGNCFSLYLVETESHYATLCSQGWVACEPPGNPPVCLLLVGVLVLQLYTTMSIFSCGFQGLNPAVSLCSGHFTH